MPLPPRLVSEPAPSPAPGTDRHASAALGSRPVPTEPTRSLATRFGLRLRDLRHATGKTQLEIAVDFGIDRTFLSDVERGRKSISLPFIEVLALGYGLSLSDLLRDL